MEEPRILTGRESPEPGTKKNARKTMEDGSKQRKMSGVALSYIIVLVAFAIGIIVCSVDGGSFDLQITKFFSDLGLNETNPDSSVNFWHQLGKFFDPDIIEGEAWDNLWIGQLFSTIVIVIAAGLIIIPAIQLGIEKKNAKKENRKIVTPASMRFYKYGWLIGFVGIVAAIGIIQLFKNFWGRPRPDELFTNFVPWFSPQGFDQGESFMSGHVAQATLVTGLALAFLGSRKKYLSIVFGIFSIILVVLTGLARMLSNAHYFSDVLWGGFMTYSIMLLTYFWILDIPGQEQVHRYERTYTPFNEGYKLVLDGKAKLKENVDEGLKLVSAGLEKFAAAKAAAVEINKFHHEFDAFITRIDDLTSRLGALINEHQSLAGKKEKNDAYLLKWSYIC
ncbi:MAG: phosphatase PAP2 family protein [Candidatus Lokiarchaeota archaeon]|nr:phosphatase PAP2 family protein [Candidatus Lokiarchaeota archaeon]